MGDTHLCAPCSCSSRIASADDRWICCAELSRASGVTAATTAEAFLPLAFRLRLLSWECSATGAIASYKSYEWALSVLSLRASVSAKMCLSKNTRPGFIKVKYPRLGRTIPPDATTFAPKPVRIFFFRSHVVFFYCILFRGVSTTRLFQS